MAKPSPGVCGKCGKPVVRPTAIPADAVETSGHTYINGKLTKVRCRDHDERALEEEREKARVFGPDWRTDRHG